MGWAWASASALGGSRRGLVHLLWLAGHVLLGQYRETPGPDCQTALVRPPFSPRLQGKAAGLLPGPAPLP